MLQFIGKFVGPEEIIEVRNTGTKTHRDVDIVEVITKREGSEGKTRLTTTTLKSLELVATDVAKDWNYVQVAKLEQVVRELMNIATDYGVSGGELQPMLARFGMALAVRFEHAAHIKFEGNDDEFVPGGNEFHAWSLAKAEHVISSSKSDVQPETNN
jgi:hypothetical protein